MSKGNVNPKINIRNKNITKTHKAQQKYMINSISRHLISEMISLHLSPVTVMFMTELKYMFKIRSLVSHACIW